MQIFSNLITHSSQDFSNAVSSPKTVFVMFNVPFQTEERWSSRGPLFKDLCMLCVNYILLPSFIPLRILSLFIPQVGFLGWMMEHYGRIWSYISQLVPFRNDFFASHARFRVKLKPEPGLCDFLVKCTLWCGFRCLFHQGCLYCGTCRMRTYNPCDMSPHV